MVQIEGDVLRHWLDYLASASDQRIWIGDLHQSSEFFQSNASEFDIFWLYTFDVDSDKWFFTYVISSQGVLEMRMICTFGRDLCKKYKQMLELDIPIKFAQGLAPCATIDTGIACITVVGYTTGKLAGSAMSLDNFRTLLIQEGWEARTLPRTNDGFTWSHSSTPIIPDANVEHMHQTPAEDYADSANEEHGPVEAENMDGDVAGNSPEPSPMHLRTANDSHPSTLRTKRTRHFVETFLKEQRDERYAGDGWNG